MPPIAFLLLACQNVQLTQGDSGLADTGVQPSLTRLSASTDLCAWEDGELVDREEEPPEGYVSIDQASPYLPCLDGLFHVSTTTLVFEGKEYSGYDADASVFDVADEGVSWMKGSWEDPLEGLDDCGLAVTSSSGLGAGASVAWLDPGAVELAGSTGTWPMGRIEGGEVLRWAVDLQEAGVDPDFGATFDFSLEGSEGVGGWGGFDGVELTEAVQLPDQLLLTAPVDLATAIELPRADTTLEWTGSGEEPLRIELTSDDGSSYVLLFCYVEDDGEFTLPGELLERFPTDGTNYLLMSRVHHSWLGASDGRSFHGRGFSSFDSYGFDML